MVVYKLYYFDIRGVAEPIRFLFKYAGVEFQDIRVSKEEWPSLKSNMPMEQLPVLEIDGEKVFQSIAICRYLGGKFGLGGKDEWENLQIDAVIETFTDLRTKITLAYKAPADKQEEMIANLKQEILPFYLRKFNEMAERNNGYMAVKRLTWVDIFVTALSSVLISLDEDAYTKYPGLGKVKENVESIENIKKWIAERPVTEF